MKRSYISKRYQEDKSTAMGKSDEMAKAFDDVINLSLGDPDLITDERIINAAFEDAKRGHTKYTDFRGDPELREALYAGIPMFVMPMLLYAWKKRHAVRLQAARVTTKS